MSKVDRQALRALAEKATPGAWGKDGVYVCTTITAGETIYVQTWNAVAESHQESNAQFIAAANPATVLALLDEIEALREKAEKFAIIERCMDQLECDEREGGIWTIWTLLLIGSAHRLNSSNSVVTQEDVTVEGQDIGDWRVTVDRISKGGSDRGR